MPSSANKVQNKDQFKHGFKARAERISTSFRKDLDVSESEPLSSFLLAKHLKIELLTPLQIFGNECVSFKTLTEPPGSECWSAITIESENRNFVIYNDCHSDGRTESNIMHELAHVILKHEMAEIDVTLGLPLRKYNPEHEMEAEWLGACLQLPKPALMKYYVFKNNTIPQIASIFNASVAMVNYRVRVSGVQIFKNRYKNNRS